MADNELTQQEVLALASAFPVASAKTLLSAARFPSWAIPESGFANAREFWIKIAEQLAAGVMPDGRTKILTEARRVYPWSTTIPEPSSNATAAVRVLVIGASPIDSDLPRVRADREAHAIEGAALPDRVAVKVVLGAEATDVRQVASFRPDVLHFVCHGTADSLVFNDSRGESDYVKATRVAELLGFYRDTADVRLRAIVLAACDGHALAPYFASVADTVIAHRGQLSDPCGETFAQQFYRLLNEALDRGPEPQLPDLTAIAREAAQLTAQYSAACEPVIENLILLPGSR